MNSVLISARARRAPKLGLVPELAVWLVAVICVVAVWLATPELPLAVRLVMLLGAVAAVRAAWRLVLNVTAR